jgi:hypothetical protein
MKRILDSDFQYRPSYDTNVRETFERARREQRQLKQSEADAHQQIALNVLRLARKER